MVNVVSLVYIWLASMARMTTSCRMFRYYVQSSFPASIHHAGHHSVSKYLSNILICLRVALMAWCLISPQFHCWEAEAGTIISKFLNKMTDGHYGQCEDQIWSFVQSGTNRLCWSMKCVALEGGDINQPKICICICINVKWFILLQTIVKWDSKLLHLRFCTAL